MSTLRFKYEGEPFADDFVEFTDSWTRRETRQFIELDGADWLRMVAQKVIAVRMGAVTDPAQLTDEAFEDMDIRLYRWFAMAASAAYVQVNRLGEAAASRLSATFAAATQTKTNS